MHLIKVFREIKRKSKSEILFNWDINIRLQAHIVFIQIEFIAT